MKNKNGFALFYTLAIMMIVFSVCSLIVVNTLALSSYSNSYAELLQNQRLCAEIAEIYCGSKGDIDNFYNELQKRDFFVDSNQTATKDISFSLDVTTAIDSYRLKIYNDTILLLVEYEIKDNKTEIKQWTCQVKGDDK